MTMAAQEPVMSGHGYTITEVDGHRPAGLGDCVGDRMLSLVGNGLTHRVFGTGLAVPGGVRFHQKDLGPAPRPNPDPESTCPGRSRHVPSPAGRESGTAPSPVFRPKSGPMLNRRHSKWEGRQDPGEAR